MTPEQIEEARRMYQQEGKDCEAIGELLGFSPVAIWYHVRDLRLVRGRRPIGQRPNLFANPATDFLAMSISNRETWRDIDEIIEAMEAS